MEVVNPQTLATRRRVLSQEYQQDMKELGEILKRKAFAIIEIRGRDDVKTSKQAEEIWATTDDGQRYLTLLFKTKGLIELIRCSKTEIDIMNNEAFGTY